MHVTALLLCTSVSKLPHGPLAEIPLYFVCFFNHNYRLQFQGYLPSWLKTLVSEIHEILTFCDIHILAMNITWKGWILHILFTFLGVKGVQVEEIYDLQSKCQRSAHYYHNHVIDD